MRFQGAIFAGRVFPCRPPASSSSQPRYRAAASHGSTPSPPRRRRRNPRPELEARGALRDEHLEAVEAQERELPNIQYPHADYDDALAGKDEAIDETPAQQPYTRQFPKVGRNDPCPCGSGKKYKHCHGKLA